MALHLKITVIILKFRQHGSAIQYYIQKMQMDRKNSVDPDQTAPI